jgi:hypothetical protein
MIVEALKWLNESFQNRLADIQTISDQLYVKSGGSFTPLVLKAEECLEVSTLSALCEYAALAPTKKHGTENAYVLIEGAGKVSLVTHPDQGNHGVRYTLVRAESELKPFEFGIWMSMDAMRVSLLTRFAQTPDRDALLGMCGKIEKVNEETFEDDGFGIEVTTRKGVSMVGTTRVPSIVSLSPFRSFPEVGTVSSPFLFRVRDKNEQPEFALFETDGGIWKQQQCSLVAQKVLELLKAYNAPQYKVLY